MKAVVTGLGALALVVTLTACDNPFSTTSKATQEYQDAPVATPMNTAPAEIIAMPDGFSNIATKCDTHGHRVYVIFHKDGTYGAVAAVDDSACPGSVQVLPSQKAPAVARTAAPAIEVSAK